jgi:hypothetical protein
MRPKLTYANVMATIAVFIALGGASYAALRLPKNSVGPKQLKRNAVRTAKVKNEAITAAKVRKGTLTGAQINLSTLGTVPTAESAESAKTAAVADSLPPAERWHEVGAPGEPQFLNAWVNVGFGSPTAGFYKDRLGIVHLKGAVKAPQSNNESIFKLPRGFRPASGGDFTFLAYCAGGVICEGNAERVDVLGSDYEAVPEYSGNVSAYPANLVSLSGVSFRAES